MLAPPPRSPAKATNSPFPGSPTKMEIVLTGEFSKSKKELKALMEAQGITLSPHLKRKTAALCVGANPKKYRAEEAMLYSVPVVDGRYIEAILAGKQANIKDYLKVPDYEKAERERNPPPRLRSAISAPSISLQSPKRSYKLKENQRQSSVARWNARPGNVSPLTGSPTKPQSQASAEASQHDTIKDKSGRIVVALEGLIGVGKSTLSGKVASSFPSSTHVFQEPINPEFLALFYSDPAKYGFAFQWGMLKSRIFQLQLAKHAHVCNTPSAHLGPLETRDYQREKMVNNCYIWDRSMIGDYIFALQNHLSGGISEREFMVYESEFGGSIRKIDELPFLKDISFFIFLNDEPERCKFRVENVRGHAAEKEIPLAYYEGLDDLHFDIFILKMLPSKAKPVFVLNFGQYDDPVQMRHLMNEIHDSKPNPPKVTYIKHNEAVPTKNVIKHYYSFKDVYKMYTKEVVPSYPANPTAPSSTTTGSTLPASKAIPTPKSGNVVFSADCWKDCIIAPEKKVVRSDNCPILFFANEFKRVVLYHLAHGTSIYFCLPEEKEQEMNDGDETDTTDTEGVAN